VAELATILRELKIKTSPYFPEKRSGQPEALPAGGWLEESPSTIKIPPSLS
jgi:hypothetical protein